MWRRIPDIDGKSRGMEVRTLAKSRISSEARWSHVNTHFTLPVESQITKLGSLEDFLFVLQTNSVGDVLQIYEESDCVFLFVCPSWLTLANC